MPSNTDQLDAKLLDNIEWLRDDGSNWKVWKAQTIIALEHREVLDFIENPIPRPTPIYMSPGKATTGQSLRPMDTVANADDIAVWDRNNRISKMQIFMTLEHAVADLYDDKAVASELWNALRAHFEGKGLVAVAALAAQLWRYVMLPDKDMTVQVQEIKSIALKLKNLGFPLSEEYQAIVILIALPHDWSTLNTIILNKSGPLSLQDTIDSILEHKTTLCQQQERAMIVHNRPKS